jgi:hypothetical protein
MASKLKINSRGAFRPDKPSRSFDYRESHISYPATNLNATPLFYIGPRVNTLWSSLSPRSPNSYAVLKYGNVKSVKSVNNIYNAYNGTNMHKIFGNYGDIGSVYKPDYVPNLNITVDAKGNYKFVDRMGKNHRIYSDANGNYVKYQKKKVYM